MILQQISERWFLSEPLFFSTLCCHKAVENRDMLCPFRSGKLLLEYNPDILDGLSDLECELLLRRELIRILLKHPYQRQPLKAVPELQTLASDITIYEHSNTGINPLQDIGFKLPEKLSFEEYYNLLDHQADMLNINDANEGESASADGQTSESSDNNTDRSSPDSENDEPENGNVDDESATETSDSNRSKSLSQALNDKALADASALWEEDEFLCERMNQIIENAMVSNQWGSITGGMKGLLEMSVEKSLNVRRQLGLFKASILSTQRRLTRMRPSRRYGWEQMGVVHPYTTRLLIAVDTSGSVSDDDIRRFFGIVNSFFTYGIPQIDVIQFDADIQLPLLSIRKAAKSVKIVGRGGTNFQPVINYFEDHKEYDGMIIFTDGYAPIPTITTCRRILWALINHQCYNDFELMPKIYL